MRKTFLSNLIVAATALFLFVPGSAFAAELTFKLIPNTESSDNTISVDVRVDPQSKSVNVVEGEILFSGAASNDLTVQVENGLSVLSIWPTLPQYDKDQKKVTFTGGVPNGFDAEGLLFHLNISQASPGDLDISFANGSAYLNDGQGTKESVSSLPLKINTEKDNETAGNFFDLYTYIYIAAALLCVAAVVIILYIWIRKKTKITK